MTSADSLNRPTLELSTGDQKSSHLQCARGGGDGKRPPICRGEYGPDVNGSFKFELGPWSSMEFANFFEFGYCNTFFLLFGNYGLIRLKRFISSFTVELCN